MKKTIFYLVMLAIIPFVNSCYDDGNLKDDINDLNSKYSSLENRIAALETQVKEMNSEISSIQTIISNLEKNVYVSKVETIENGYKIHFTDNTIATIHDGKNGKDGENGVDGKDGKNAPIIGVAKDTDNVYYWTITTNGNTTWLLDNGKKLRVTGKDGENGHTPIVEIGSDNYWYIDGVKTNVKATGEDGKDGITPSISISSDGYWVINGVKSSIKAKGENGTNGEDGKDGITPLLKIDTEGYWTISYDNGKVYNRILDSTNSPVSAIGKDGENGQDGKNGEDGQDGKTPEIAIKQDSDGIYYWTKDGQWLTDQQGQKIKANGIDGENGKDAIAPKLKIENGHWLLSTDEGKSWIDIGQATGNDGKDGKDGDSFFQNVTQDDEKVTLILANGTTIYIPKYKELTITFNKTGEIVVMPGSSQTINYTITGATSKTIVKALGQGGWTAKVKATNTTSGSITITAPDPMTDDEILVLIYDGENTTIMSYIYCVQGVINITNNYYNIPATGETKEISLSTNINYSVYIPTEAKTWITQQQSLGRALRNETLTFVIAPNTGEERSATIELRDNSGKTIETIVFKQAVYALNINVTTAGTLKERMTEDDLKNVRELKIKGTLNATDFETITKSISSLTKLDLSEVNLTKLPLMAFSEATNMKSIILPDNLIEINEQDFYRCTSLESIIIPDGVTVIKEKAFEGCTSLASIDIPANVTEIKSGAFKSCTKLQTVNIPTNSNLTTIGGLTNEGAFQGCYTLSNINIPTSTEIIDSYAFYGCSNLTSPLFAVNSNLKTIKNYAFYNCSSITDIDFPEGLEIIDSYAFYGCSSITNLNIPSNVQIIKACTFYSCKNLKILNIPTNSKLTTIETDAFRKCDQLTLIKVGLTTPPYINYWSSFEDTTLSNCTVKVPVGSLDSYKNSNWGHFTKITEE